MQIEKETKNGSGDPTLDSLVVVMAVVLFFGTAQVASTHAPQMVSDILGFNADYIFGVVSAICVEWGALRLHFNPNARTNNTAKVVKWILLGMSGLAQVYNAAIETNSLSSLSETLKIGFQFVVPNIPLIFIVLMFWIGSLSPTRPKSILERISDRGIYNMLPKKDDLLYGRENTRVSSKVVDHILSHPEEYEDRWSKEEIDELEKTLRNGGQAVNPTSRRS